MYVFDFLNVLFKLLFSYFFSAKYADDHSDLANFSTRKPTQEIPHDSNHKGFYEGDYFIILAIVLATFVIVFFILVCKFYFCGVPGDDADDSLNTLLIIPDSEEARIFTLMVMGQNLDETVISDGPPPTYSAAIREDINVPFRYPPISGTIPESPPPCYEENNPNRF